MPKKNSINSKIRSFLMNKTKPEDAKTVDYYNTLSLKMRASCYFNDLFEGNERKKNFDKYEIYDEQKIRSRQNISVGMRAIRFLELDPSAQYSDYLENLGDAASRYFASINDEASADKYEKIFAPTFEEQENERNKAINELTDMFANVSKADLINPSDEDIKKNYHKYNLIYSLICVLDVMKDKKNIASSDKILQLSDPIDNLVDYVSNPLYEVVDRDLMMQDESAKDFGEFCFNLASNENDTNIVRKAYASSIASFMAPKYIDFIKPFNDTLKGLNYETKDTVDFIRKHYVYLDGKSVEPFHLSEIEDINKGKPIFYVDNNVTIKLKADKNNINYEKIDGNLLPCFKVMQEIQNQKFDLDKDITFKTFAGYGKSNTSKTKKTLDINDTDTQKYICEGNMIEVSQGNRQMIFMFYPEKDIVTKAYTLEHIKTHIQEFMIEASYDINNLQKEDGSKLDLNNNLDLKYIFDGKKIQTLVYKTGAYCDITFDKKTGAINDKYDDKNLYRALWNKVKRDTDYDGEDRKKSIDWNKDYFVTMDNHRKPFNPDNEEDLQYLINGGKLLLTQGEVQKEIQIYRDIRDPNSCESGMLIFDNDSYHNELKAYDEAIEGVAVKIRANLEPGYEKTLQMINDADPALLHSHQEYKNLKAAMIAYNWMNSRDWSKLSSSKTDRDIFIQRTEKLKDLAQAYLDSKKNKQTHSTYETARMNAAREVQRYAEEQLTRVHEIENLKIAKIDRIKTEQKIAQTGISSMNFVKLKKMYNDTYSKMIDRVPEPVRDSIEEQLSILKRYNYETNNVTMTAAQDLTGALIAAQLVLDNPKMESVFSAPCRFNMRLLGESALYKNGSHTSVLKLLPDDLRKCHIKNYSPEDKSLLLCGNDMPKKLRTFIIDQYKIIEDNTPDSINAQRARKALKGAGNVVEAILQERSMMADNGLAGKMGIFEKNMINDKGSFDTMIIALSKENAYSMIKEMIDAGVKATVKVATNDASNKNISGKKANVKVKSL